MPGPRATLFRQFRRRKYLTWGNGTGFVPSVGADYSEAQMVPLYEGAALYPDIDHFLRGRGFEMYRIQEIFSNGPEERTTCCDALWVRSDVLAGFVQRARAKSAAA